MYALGFGVRLAILAVMTALVDSATETGKLYTLVAMTDAMAHMIASPLLQWLWATALGLTKPLLVLPFLFLTVSFLGRILNVRTS